MKQGSREVRAAKIFQNMDDDFGKVTLDYVVLELEKLDNDLNPF